MKSRDFKLACPFEFMFPTQNTALFRAASDRYGRSRKLCKPTGSSEILIRLIILFWCLKQIETF